MKLVFLKLSALLLIVVGVVLIGQFVQCPYICSYVAKTTDGSLDVLFPGSFKLLSGTVLVLIGVYSFLPTFRCKKPVIQTIKQTLDNGISEINLATVEKECEAMLKKVAPLKQVSVSMSPSKDQKKVHVEINPLILLKEGENLPNIQELIIQRTEEFLNSYFGISISLPITIKLNNIQLEGDKIYASLGKTAFEAVSQKYEMTQTEEEIAKKEEDSVSVENIIPSTTASEEKHPEDDYLTCKTQEMETGDKNAVPPLKEESDESDRSDKSDEPDTKGISF